MSESIGFYIFFFLFFKYFLFFYMPYFNAAACLCGTNGKCNALNGTHYNCTCDQGYFENNGGKQDGVRSERGERREGGRTN
jgi:hypothetical protein